jgi:hypothetical protein
VKVLAWCKMVRARLDSNEDPADQNKPLAMPLCEIGYSADCVKRLGQHENHQSSNYIMNLCEAVCGMMGIRRKLSKDYKMHQYVIYYCCEPAQGILAELFFTRVGHGYIMKGGGFSHYPAGLSNDTVLKGEGRSNWVHWDKLERFAAEYSPLEQNVEWARTRRKAKNEARKKLLAEEWRKVEEELDATAKTQWDLEQRMADRSTKFSRIQSEKDRLREATIALHKHGCEEADVDAALSEGNRRQKKQK